MDYFRMFQIFQEKKVTFVTSDTFPKVSKDSRFLESFVKNKGAPRRAGRSVLSAISAGICWM
jgi:hypothetical protein